jgi:hypothetical protein
MNKYVVHGRADEVAPGTPEIMRATGLLPGMQQPVLKIEILMWMVNQTILKPLANNLSFPSLEDYF